MQAALVHPTDAIERPSGQLPQASLKRTRDEDSKAGIKRRRLRVKTPAAEAHASCQRPDVANRQTANRWSQHIAASSSAEPLAAVNNRETVEAGSCGDVYYTHKIHRSHTIAAVRNILFCSKCGYWTQQKTEQLRSPCVGVPPHNLRQCQLNRLRQGKYPRVGSWGDGTPANHIFPVRQITHTAVVHPSE